VYSTFRFWLFVIAVVLILLSATRRESLFINIAIFKFTVHLETVVLHLFRLPFSPASVSISLLTYAKEGVMPHFIYMLKTFFICFVSLRNFQCYLSIKQKEIFKQQETEMFD